MLNRRTIYSGLGRLHRALEMHEWDGAKFVILLDENTFQHCFPLLIQRVKRLRQAEFIEVPAGEEAKSIEVAAQVWQTLIEGGADRSTVIVNLGGGCICDLGGFVASGYMRGIRHINIPTTLLAMVDAAIGGKTAINMSGVKNCIGYFHSPVLTCIDTTFLETLPEAELLNGKLEMVKTAAVSNQELYNNILTAKTSFRFDHSMLIKTIARIKVHVVKADPLDQGIRHILNFGHTFGHAIEMYSNLPHGVSVGIGMRVAMYLSVHKLGMPQEVLDEYSEWLRGQVTVPRYTLSDIEAMLALMHRDKKNADGNLLCVLLNKPGEAVIDVAVSDNEVRDAMLKLK